MIDNTKIDFDFAIKQVNRELPMEHNNQKILLDSENMNNAFKNIETSLNLLYENSRYIEDAIKYCDAFLNLKIQECSSEIKDIIKSIEDIRNTNKNSAYLEYQVYFKDDMSIKKDRDGSTIPNMVNKNEYLVLGNKKEDEISWLDIKKKSVNIPYTSNLEDINKKPYRSFYIEEQIANKGITETITITLNKPTEINYINIDTVNADINNLRLVYLNGVEEYIKYNNGLITPAIVTQIKFDLNCKRYTSSKYYIDKSKMTNDVWNKIKDYEYSYALNADSKLEMEEIIARVSQQQGSDEKDFDLFYTEISNKMDVVEKTMYSYMFGLESISIKNVEQHSDSCFISQTINIGEMKDKEYLQLHIDEILDENATVEYSLLDGDIEIPILPYGHKIIKNEKIFNVQDLRFIQDESDKIIIKKDGITTDISLSDAKQQYLSKFSIDYYPAYNYNYVPINNNIRVKATIRKYNKSVNNSYIKNIKIRKYGGDVLWTDM